MIKIVNDLSGYQLKEEGWSFIVQELDYLLEEHNEEIFWLNKEDGRLYEIEESESENNE